MKQNMCNILRALVLLQLLFPLYAFAAEDKILLDLNTVDSSENRCRLTFLIENKSEAAIETLKLDLVLFGTDGGIMRRIITEMAPLRPMKTMVRSFLVDAECHQISAILVNDIKACAPGNPDACLDRLDLSTRIKEIRLYK
jgi:hypothetical protein